MLSAADSMDLGFLPLPQRLALNYAPERIRAQTAALFALDARLGELVAKANEPLLAQLRLAWWRDELSKPQEERARGDPILDTLGETWPGEEHALIRLIDGWEQLVGAAPLPGSALESFADGRAGAFAALARLAGEPSAEEIARDAGRVWALADLAARVSDDQERQTACRLAEGQEHRFPRLPRALRPLAVLRGLAHRALLLGGAPLVTGRRDILAALRLGMIGR
ncbi:squalene/phytoene synthase family protein [Pelagerythrobacter aerophilus]|uniref:squalene/phytoene synthase family protein n=1 Tax=Pelagerythrobacter aerophilus TaxID=2306995 RepID=UPI001603FC37|nr:squalene/phytoene synthase family protein [Pelagerythrobacter aerophilus]